MEKQARAFEFTSYKLAENGQDIELRYLIEFENQERLEFMEKITLPGAVQLTSNELSIALDRSLHTLHLMAGLSYWKTYCPKTIIVKTAPLSKDEAEFWNTVYTKGLGEFFYRNQIDFRGLLNFPYENDSTQPVSLKRTERALMGVGGGKDSIVSYEQLKKENYPVTAFLLETQKEYGLLNDVLTVMGVNTLHIKRQLDEKLFTLEGAYNGHIPITGIYSVVGVVCSVAYDYKKVVMSNEKSANYGNVTYLGSEINHQWSKSEEFEQMFQNYIAQSITPDVNYSSLLRSLTELQITKKFTQYPQYFPVFSSCNNNFKVYKESLKNSRWCGVCPKCAFVFSMLAAYLPKEEVVKIFNKNLYADENLSALYRELLGIKDFKPFECVGTPDEVKEAFELARQRNEYQDDAIMKMYESEVLSK
jgi:hypothetical protein